MVWIRETILFTSDNRVSRVIEPLLIGLKVLFKEKSTVPAKLCAHWVVWTSVSKKKAQHHKPQIIKMTFCLLWRRRAIFSRVFYLLYFSRSNEKRRRLFVWSILQMNFVMNLKEHLSSRNGKTRNKLWKENDDIKIVINHKSILWHAASSSKKRIEVCPLQWSNQARNEAWLHYTATVYLVNKPEKRERNSFFFPVGWCI